MSEEGKEEAELDENVYWEKVTAIATVGALIVSTLIGLLGIYLGSQAIKLSGQVASAQMRPLLQGERVWFGPGGNSSFTIENNGFGPLEIHQSIYAHFNEDGTVGETIVIRENTTADDLLVFMKLQNFVNDSRVVVGVPSIGSVIGVDKEVAVIQIAEHQQRSQFFKAQNKDAFDNAVRRLGVCIVYDALDKRRQLFSEKGTCKALGITKRKIRLRKS